MHIGTRCKTPANRNFFRRTNKQCPCWGWSIYNTRQFVWGLGIYSGSFHYYASMPSFLHVCRFNQFLFFFLSVWYSFLLADTVVSISTALAVFLDFLLQLSAFVALIVLDFQRAEDFRIDCFPCITISSASVGLNRGLSKLNWIHFFNLWSNYSLTCRVAQLFPFIIFPELMYIYIIWRQGLIRELQVCLLDTWRYAWKFEDIKIF